MQQWPMKTATSTAAATSSLDAVDSLLARRGDLLKYHAYATSVRSRSQLGHQELGDDLVRLSTV